MTFKKNDKEILNEILKECEENLMFNTPYELTYVLNSDLTKEDKQSHIVTNCMKVLCDNTNYVDGENKTKSIDITDLVAQLLKVDCLFKIKDNHRDSYLPVTHKDNIQLKDVCAELTRKIIQVENENDIKIFKEGCTVLYRA